MEQTRRESVAPHLGLWDAVSIMLGIIIGVGIFSTPADVFTTAPSGLVALAIWLAGGLLALIGALCFAELASTYPRSGGEYVYLTRAYGPLVGFLFAWAQLAIIRPGGIAAVAYVFAERATMLWGMNDLATLPTAVGIVIFLTWINILGVTVGKHTQNVLTVLKMVGLATVIVVGLGWGHSAAAGEVVERRHESGWLATAMIIVMWTYAGWHEAAYIAAEVKSPRKNLPLALILGAAGVTVIYLVINAALWLGLGLEKARNPGAPEAILGILWGDRGERGMSVLIMVSALGALNGMIFTTARIYSEFGADHRLFQPLSHWSRRFGTPVRALIVQGAIGVALMVGTAILLNLATLDPPRPQSLLSVGDGLKVMIEVTAAVFWLFFLLTGIAVFVLRAKDRDIERPFRVPLYPVLPAVFCLLCAYMMWGAISYRSEASFIGLAILLAGVVFYFLPKKIKRKPAAAPLEPMKPTPVGAGS